VFSLTNSFSAISRLLIPCAISSRISISHGVIANSSLFASLGQNGSAKGTGTVTGTSFTTILSSFRVSFSPSQIPTAANVAAISPL
jgi:hypothetical protein